MPVASIGFRVKSGYAVAVALTGPAASPSALARGIIQLSDPENEATRQPYHDGFGTAQEDAATIATLVKTIERCGKRSIAAFLKSDALATYTRRRACLVVGSVIDPATIGNPHIRAHASEGRLFRTVVEEELRAHGVACSVIVDKQLTAHAVENLGRTEVDIKQTLTSFGNTIEGPWHSEEKAAALGAWLALK